MIDSFEPRPDLSSIRRELLVLKVSIFLMIVFSALNYISFFRLIGASEVAHYLLITYRLLDLILILYFLIFCGPKLKIMGLDLVLMIFIAYPFLIGFYRGNLSITFAHDAVIFLFFFLKIMVFRTVLGRIIFIVDIDAVFRKYARQLVFWCGFIALLLLGTAAFFLARGVNFYYQAPAELTFATALVIAKGNVPAYLFFLILALIGGKRMIMAGLLVMGAVAALSHPRVRWVLIRYSAAFVGPVLFFIYFGGGNFNTDLIFVDRILGTFQQLSYSFEMSESLLESLMLLDPARFAEYVSLKPHLSGWSLWFGNGYGFRYELDSNFLTSFGYSVDTSDVTNAHFTPLGIAAKFGLVGVFIWFVLIAVVVKSGFARRSYVQYACWLAFLSDIFQSFFAFGFFISFFTPFYVAMATSGASSDALSRRLLGVRKQPEGYK